MNLITFFESLNLDDVGDISSFETPDYWAYRVLDLLKERRIKYTIDSEGFCNVDGDVDLSECDLKDFGLVQFGTVIGSFFCDSNQLTSLEGAPKRVDKSFYCNDNQLISLEGAPKEVGNSFNCNNNHLTSLEGAPEEVGSGFYCNDNQLTTLEGAPKRVGGLFDCSYNQLVSLVGAPKKVDGSFYCDDNPVSATELLATIGRK